MQDRVKHHRVHISPGKGCKLSSSESVAHRPPLHQTKHVHPLAPRSSTIQRRNVSPTSGLLGTTDPREQASMHLNMSWAEIGWLNSSKKPQKIQKTWWLGMKALSRVNLPPLLMRLCSAVAPKGRTWPKPLHWAWIQQRRHFEHLGVFFTLKQPFVRELLKPGWLSSTTAATRIVAGLPLCVAWCWAEDLALATASAKPMRQAIVLLKTSSTFQREGIPSWVPRMVYLTDCWFCFFYDSLQFCQAFRACTHSSAEGHLTRQKPMVNLVLTLQVVAQIQAMVGGGPCCKSFLKYAKAFCHLKKWPWDHECVCHPVCRVPQKQGHHGASIILC